MNHRGNECSAGDPLEPIRSLYTDLALHPENDFGWGKGKENARALGYAAEWLTLLPDSVWESAAAVGNPFSLGPLHAGETVVDIGCGAGADVCIAALLVGKGGKVFGVDCTPAMIAKANENATAAGLSQVVWQEADMTKLPLPDCSADIIISNGAINLAEDKHAVLGEVFRVLRPGGRLQIADMVRDLHAGDSACCSGNESWADCVAGTVDPDTFLAMMTKVGFIDAQLAGFTGYRTASSTTGALFKAIKPG
jgi:arsenite methyltransferase